MSEREEQCKNGDEECEVRRTTSENETRRRKSEKESQGNVPIGMLCQVREIKSARGMGLMMYV